MKWFSSLLKFVILIEGKGGSRFARSVILFKAHDFESAKGKALRLGASKETTYINNDNQKSHGSYIQLSP